MQQDICIVKLCALVYVAFFLLAGYGVRSFRIDVSHSDLGRGSDFLVSCRVELQLARN